MEWVFKLLAAFGFLAGCTLTLLVIWEFRFGIADGFRPDRSAISLDSSDKALGFTTIQLPMTAGAGQLTAFYRPSRNGRLVILLHGTDASRAALMPEARVLVGHGFGVLLPDLPGHGASDGKIQWGAAERAAVGDCVAWLVSQPENVALKLGLYGFSFGSTVAIQYAAVDERIKALAVAGAFPTVMQLFEAESGHYGLIAQYSWLAAYYTQGTDIREHQPIQLIASLAPRPLLIISGSSDALVPSYLSDKLFDAALPPKRRLVINGAKHGTYLKADEAKFTSELITFFNEM